MLKVNQNEEVLTALYDDTMDFTRELQGHYYKQFRGDVDDLASDLYMEFLEQKGPERLTLLDRYDREDIDDRKHWRAYIRTAVSRALIDESRTHPWSVVSFDEMLDECGDSMKLSNALTTEDSIDNYDYDEVSDTLKARALELTPKQFNKIKNKYMSLRSILVKPCVKVFDDAFNPRLSVSSSAGMLPIYRVSGDSTFAVYNGRIEEFSRTTGKPKREVSVTITPKGLEYVRSIRSFESDEKRKDFVSLVIDHKELWR